MAANSSTSIRIPHTTEAQDSITRLANTTQYAAGDAMSDHATTPTAAGYFTLTLANVNGGSGRIVSATLHSSDTDTTNKAVDVLLFDTLPAVAGFRDNVACAITDAEMLTCKGRLRFSTGGEWTVHGTGDFQCAELPPGGKGIGFVCASTAKALYGIPVWQAAYTPASAEVFTLTVQAEAD